MKLEIGMYVRLQNDAENIVIISRIANVFETTILTENDGSIYQGEYTKENVVKASYSIIDILEVGDYVNGSKVIDISIIGKDKEKWVWVEQMEDTDNKYGDDYVGYNNEQIKSIVTKEQFESMEYSLEVCYERKSKKCSYIR